MKEGARVHGVEALQWIHRRFNLGADHLAKKGREGNAWWMVAFPQAFLGVDVIACTDAGVCVQEGCATQGGYLLTRETQECNTFELYLTASEVPYVIESCRPEMMIEITYVLPVPC